MKKYKTLKGLFKDYKHWTKDTYARDSSGVSQKLTSPKAVSFCLHGGLKLVYTNHRTRAAAEKRILKVITKLYPKFVYNIVGFNDSNATHIKDIRKVVKLANV